MNTTHRAGSILLAAIISGCAGSPTAPDRSVTFAYDFNDPPQGWASGVVDNPVSLGRQDMPIMHEPLPAELAVARSAIRTITGPDVTVFYSTRVAGLRPDVTYHASFRAQIATDVPHNCPGPGGSPGEHTRVYAAAFQTEPVVVADGGWYRLNYYQPGASHLVAMGNIANSVPCQSGPGGILRIWEFKELTGSLTTRLRPALDGSAWLYIGHNALFFGNIEFYYARFSVILTPE
jgi:hypothetical protein